MEETRRWASLMPELVDRVANRLLDTADIDCYMALRAVCHSWRAATDDPRNTLDPRFRPRGWVMLDYPSHGEDARLLVNTATGRFHGRRMPLLRAYFVVSVTADGLLVLAARDPPHAACVLHPFTGHMVRFAARMRAHVLAAAVSGSGSSPPYLVLYCRDTMKLYRATPDSEVFVRYKKKYAYPLVRKAVQGLVAVDGHQGLLPPLPAAVVAKIADLMTPVTSMPADMPAHEIDTASWKRCFVVESAGETLVVFKLENRVEVFKMDMAANTLEHIKSIGNRAIFISGCDRCVSLDADKFPSIEANCIYFTDRLGSPSTDMYRLEEDGEQAQSVVSASSESASSVNLNLPAFLCNPMTAHPFTIIQLLSIYTFNMQSGQVTQVIEREDRILEKLRSGEMSFSDLLRSCQADSDADD